MKNSYLSFLIIVVFTSCYRTEQLDKATKADNKDWFINQRAYPYHKVDYNAYQKAFNFYQHQLQNNKMRTTSSLWNLAGPVNIGGRLTDVEMHASSLTTMYLCAASGGVFKSTNAGTTWTPIFDGVGSLSIGDLAIAPSDSNTIYVGTGEANAGGGSLCYDADGIYKSTDAGVTWQSIGLQLTRNTGRIAIHPTNKDIVYAATMGDLFGNNAERGLYKTNDGGTTWTQSLYLNDSTGAVEVVINPVNPDTVFACMWTRVRRPDRRNYGGPESGIYRSFDGGNTWNKLNNPFGSFGNLGRIGIDISKSNPNILYAYVLDDFGSPIGIFKSINSGNSWTNVSSNAGFASVSYWYGRIKIDPTNPDVVYLIDFDLWKTTDGGNNWNNISSGQTHVDQHEVYIHPQNSNLVLLGNDGGFYTSYDGGTSFIHNETLPVTQFYTCEVDEQQPNNYYGGTQDNGTVMTPNGSTTNWTEIWGGDGFVVRVDPTQQGSWTAEYQYAGLSCGLNGVNTNHKFNWNTPYMHEPGNPMTMYLGSNHMYKSLDKGANWFEISPDLSNGIGPSSYPIVYATITTLDVAASDPDVIYAGTDDGNVHVTTDGGQTWTKISNNLPVRWVTRVAVDPRNALDCYVTLSGYRYHDNMSHIYHTTDGGANWVDIQGNLPDMPINTLVVDTMLNQIYIGSDAGVYHTAINQWNNWNVLGSGMPAAPVTDLRLHYPTHSLTAATYGRSMYNLSLSTAGLPTTTLNNANPLVINTIVNNINQNVTLAVYAGTETTIQCKVVDLKGNVVFAISDQKVNKGNTEIQFALNNKLASGKYIAVVANSKVQRTSSFVIIKE